MQEMHFLFTCVFIERKTVKDADTVLIPLIAL